MSEQQIFAKCAWRLIPFMALLVMLNFIDRVNVGFAALTMNKDLGFSPAVFGFGAGVFFLGYSLFVVPANVLVERIGARRGVFWVLATWGPISAACALVQGPAAFYLLRFLLGIAECALLPGLLCYLALWFPQSYRARMTAMFMIGIPLAGIVGGPLGGLILGMNGLLGLHGWQWLFLLEGLPAVLLAFPALRLLPDRPANAAWLNGEEKQTIANRLAADRTPIEQRALWPALRDPRIIALSFAWLCITSGGYGAGIWLPQVLQAIGFANLAIGLLISLATFVAMIGMIAWGRSSDRNGERIWHASLPSLLGAAGFLAASIAHSNGFAALALAFVWLCNFAVFGPFLSLPTAFLSGPALAGGMALIGAFGSLGGFVGPFLIGVLKQQTGNYSAAMAALAVELILSGAIMLALGRTMAPRHQPSPAQ
jgi:MFS transporter, ACS family, tartrate transporter